MKDSPRTKAAIAAGGQAFKKGLGWRVAIRAALAAADAHGPAGHEIVLSRELFTAGGQRIDPGTYRLVRTDPPAPDPGF